MSVAFPSRVVPESAAAGSGQASPSSVASGKKDGPFRQDLNIRLICPDCKSAQLIEEFSSGDLVCGNCGLIVGDRVVDTRSEWRTFAGDEGDDPSRVGGPSNSLVTGVDTFETVISFKDGHTGVSQDLNRAAQRVASANRGDRGVNNAFQAIQDLCDTISLPKTVADIAKQLYRRSDELKLLRGKGLDAIVAACIFIACRQARVGRSFKEIVQLSGVPKKSISACFKILSQHFETATTGGGGAFNLETGEVSGAGAEALVERFCNQLGLPYNVQRATYNVAVKQRDVGSLAGRSPISVAAACIFFTCCLYGHKKPPSEIAKVTAVSEVTLKLAYKIMYATREKVVDEEAIKSGAARLDRLPVP